DGGRRIPRIRSDVEHRANGGPLPAARAQQVDALLKAIASSDVSDRKLYRGMMIPGFGDQVAGRDKPWSKPYPSGSSFSGERGVSEGFMCHSAGQRRQAQRMTPVMLHWEDGPKKALPIVNNSQKQSSFNENEYLASGDFDIVSTRTDRDGVVHVKIRQAKPL